MTAHLHTRVAVVGAGPGGLTLATLLHRQGIDCLVVDKFPREQLLARARAGFLERRTVQLLDRHGLSGRMRTEGIPHTACEFRVAGESIVLDYEHLSPDAPSYVYPQQDVVSDLLEAFTAEGGRLLLGNTVTAVDTGGELPCVHCADGTRISADLVVEAAGQHGPVASRLSAGTFTTVDEAHGIQLLGVLTAAPPSAPHTVYGRHPHGFAGHMLRSRDVTRMYLEMGPGETLDDWPEERIWQELELRLAAPGQKLNRGPLLERSAVAMHTRVVEPMHYGRIALLGDAAHIVPPSGGKGMNLAMADAAGLAGLLGAHAAGERWPDTPALLESWSRQRLADVWQVQQFSHAMLTLLHGHAAEGPHSSYGERLRAARLHRLRDDPHTSRAFLERYLGPPLDGGPSSRSGLQEAAA